MTSPEPIPPAILKRKAVVYVRQSSQSQVQTNLESKRRQYDLVDVARQRGFVDVDVIDDDLGRSASGTVARPGFDRLVAWLCAGKVGAVLCFDASRLARNGRDWHHLLELCGLVEARVIDLDGVYNPCRPNDRLLLGMKGSISEFELISPRSRRVWRCASAPRPRAATWWRRGTGRSPRRMCAQQNARRTECVGAIAGQPLEAVIAVDLQHAAEARRGARPGARSCGPRNRHRPRPDGSGRTRVGHRPHSTRDARSWSVRGRDRAPAGWCRRRTPWARTAPCATTRS